MRRLLAVLTGYKIELETLQKEVSLYSMEEASVQNGIIHRRPKLFASGVTERDDLARTLENLVALHSKKKPAGYTWNATTALCLVGVDVEWIRGRFSDVGNLWNHFLMV